MKQLTRIIVLIVLVSAALFVARTFALPSNQFGAPSFSSGTGPSPRHESEHHGTLPSPVLTATPGDSQVTISWQPVSGAERYLLYVRVGFDAWQRLDDGALTGTSFIHSDVTTGSTYVYTARTVSADGVYGHWAPQVEATVTGALAAPVLEATVALSMITLTWQPVEGAETYEIWVTEGANPQRQLDDGSLTATSFTHTGFMSTGAYLYKARAVFADGADGPWSAEISAVLTQILPVPELTTTPDADEIALSWDALTNADSYELKVWDSLDGWDQLDDGALTATSFTHTGLTSGRTYHYWLRALTTNGAQGPWSERTTAPAFAATTLSADPGDDQIALSWDAVTGADTYELKAYDTVDGWTQLDDGSLTAASFNHTGLTVGSTYYYWVRALSDEGGQGPWSERVGAPALAATVLTATAGAGEVALSWDAVTGADTYEIQVYDEGNDWEQLDDGSLTATTFTHSNATTGTTYYYWVRAVSDEDVGGPWSERVDATP